MRTLAALGMLVLAGACTNYSGAGDPGSNDQPRTYDPRFVGLWAVTQPYHALYEQTLYTFHQGGQLEVGASIPSDCTGHLSRHCVTGSVANCKPAAPGESCTSTLTCVFGGEWYSHSDTSLVIVGACSDSVERSLAFTLSADSSNNAGFGADATLVSVDGDANWTHDNWDWAFQKCPDGDPDTCPFGSPLP